MKHVPKYLLPRVAVVPASATAGDVAAVPATAPAQGGEGETGFVPFTKGGARGRGRGRGRGGRGGRGGGGGAGRGGKKKSDPLKKFR